MFSYLWKKADIFMNYPRRALSCFTFPLNMVQIYVLGEGINFGTQKSHLLFPVKSQMIAFPSQDIKFLFSDIQHVNKKGLIGEEIRSINTT
jgi:hypothetical protein